MHLFDMNTDNSIPITNKPTERVGISTQNARDITTIVHDDGDKMLQEA